MLFLAVVAVLAAVVKFVCYSSNVPFSLPQQPQPAPPQPPLPDHNYHRCHPQPLPIKIVDVLDGVVAIGKIHSCQKMVKSRKSHVFVGGEPVIRILVLYVFWLHVGVERGPCDAFLEGSP